MLRWILRHVSYANVASTLALLLAMSGGAYAARHYLISSKRQINPRVIRELRGQRGRTGRTGATGERGPAGARGAQGPAGPGGAGGPTGPEGGGAVGRSSVGPTGPTGAAGQPQSAVAFIKAREAEDNTSLEPESELLSRFTPGGEEIPLRFFCGNFDLGEAHLAFGGLTAADPSGGSAEAGLLETNKSGKPVEAAPEWLELSRNTREPTTIAAVAVNKKEPETYRAHVNGSIIATSAVIEIDALLEVSPAEPRYKCTARGTAFSMPR